MEGWGTKNICTLGSETPAQSWASFLALLSFHLFICKRSRPYSLCRGFVRMIQESVRWKEHGNHSINGSYFIIILIHKSSCLPRSLLINYLRTDNSLVNPLCCSAHCLTHVFWRNKLKGGKSYCLSLPPTIFTEGFLAWWRWISFPSAPPTLMIQAVRGGCLL